MDIYIVVDSYYFPALWARIPILTAIFLFLAHLVSITRERMNVFHHARK